MKQLLLALFLSSAAYAQWQSVGSGDFVLNGILDSKPNFQLVVGAPTALACTAGKDYAFDTAGLNYWDCKVTGNPGTWALRGSFPGAGIPVSTGSAWSTSYTLTTLTAALGACASGVQGLVPATGGGTVNFLRADCTFAAPPAQVYPAAGVPNSTGSAWGSSYTVGTAANNLVQLNGSAQLPAVSAALLTNFPTFNQSTTGNAATATNLASYPALCSGGQYSQGLSSGSNNCGGSGFSPTGTQVANSPVVATSGSAYGWNAILYPTSLTSGGILYGSSATQIASSALLGSGQFVLGGGAGSAPTTSFSVVPGANGGTGVANTGLMLTLAGNVAFTGAFNPTFAIPATGTWTFPAAGTLVNTGVTTLPSLASIGTALTANFFLAAPNGSAGAAVARAIVAADIPTLNQNTTGTSGGFTSYPTLCTGGQYSQGLSSGSNNCGTPSGSGGGFAGVNTQTSSYALVSGDSGKLVIMNCSSACTVTLYGSPGSTYYGGIESIGSTVATVSLNSLTFNGSSSVPVLLSYQILNFYSNGTNYFGPPPPVAGTQVTLTPTSNGLTFNSSSGVVGSVTTYGTSQGLSGSNCSNMAVATAAITFTLPAPPQTNCPILIGNVASTATTISSSTTMKDIYSPSGSTTNRTLGPGQTITAYTDGTVWYLNWYQAGTLQTISNCSSSASPAVCASASAGSVAFPTGVTSVALTVNTTAVTANSQIFMFPDDSLGTKLSVTCNSTLATLVGGMAITARTAGTSFTVTFNGTIATNPVCASFLIVN